MLRIDRASRATSLALATVVLLVGPAPAEVRLPPGFSAQVYVTGQGFEGGRSAQGIPATTTLVFDQSGSLYLARAGRRYQNTEADDLTTVYRVPPGGARMTPDTEARYLYGPPLRNPQTGGVRAGRELFVTTFDRDRRLGAVYRMLDGRAQLFAGGTPPRDTPPLLRQPEGVAVDSTGHVYVADRESGAVVRLDPAGRVLDPPLGETTEKALYVSYAPPVNQNRQSSGPGLARMRPRAFTVGSCSCRLLPT
jgi:glucose/arabinose dehydrogenase